jgi:hypothetical protein
MEKQIKKEHYKGILKTKQEKYKQETETNQNLG